MTDTREISTATAVTDLGAANNSALSQVERMFSLVMSAATNPDVDAGKMTALVDLQMRMMDYQKAEQFAKAKVAALREMPTIGKNGAIVVKGVEQSKYAKFEDIQHVVDPILHRHGLVISFEIGQLGNRVSVRPVLTHTSGHVEKGEAMPLDIDTTGSKNATQGAGSAATYGKRHAMIAALNLRVAGVGMPDDDGNGAGNAGPALQPFERDLLARAEAEANNGPTSYLEWFKSQDAASKGWLVFGKHHDRFKEHAQNL